jgi:regulator of protease activity HflC (stomatin/prohibitin superfamily)
MVGFVYRHIMSAILVLMVLVLVGAALYPATVRNIAAGEVGVIWRRFGGGTDVATILPEGLHVILPFDRVTMYNARLRRMETEVKVLTREGILADVKVAVRFRLEPAMVGWLHKFLGPDYLDTLILPVVSARIRAVLGAQRPEHLFSSVGSSLAIEQEIETYVRERVRPTHASFADREIVVHVVDVLITGVALPTEVNAAIERRAAQEQAALEYVHRLERERMEAERRRIEVESLKAYHDTLAPALSDAFLRWRGIQVMERLADSPNSRLMIFNSSGAGVPVVLSPSDVPPASLARPEPPAAAPR